MNYIIKYIMNKEKKLIVNNTKKGYFLDSKIY